jgi:hypothetical protein
MAGFNPPGERILLDVFEGLKMAYPEPTAKRQRGPPLIRKTLV